MHRLWYMSICTDQSSISGLLTGKVGSWFLLTVVTTSEMKGILATRRQIKKMVHAVACPSLHVLQACLHAMSAQQCSLPGMYELRSMNGTASILCHLGLSLCNMRLDQQLPRHSSAQAQGFYGKGLQMVNCHDKSHVHRYVEWCKKGVEWCKKGVEWCKKGVEW